MHASIHVYALALRPCIISALVSDVVDRCAVRSTIDVPSRNRAWNRTFAFVNSSSFNDTTINWEPLNRVRKSCPMCCVCEGSSAASRMYMGAGLNWRSAIISESAMRDLYLRSNSCVNYLPSLILSQDHPNINPGTQHADQK